MTDAVVSAIAENPEGTVREHVTNNGDTAILPIVAPDGRVLHSLVKHFS